MSIQIDRKTRGSILAEIKDRIARAQKILEPISHPDDDPRKVEEALGLIDEIDIDVYDGLTGDDLVEHYFS